jgi:hypothetical protein
VSRRRAAVVLTAIITAVVLAPALAGAPAAAQVGPPGTTYLSLASVSPWVAADGTWSVRWSIAVEPPLDSVLRYTVHQAFSGAEARRRLDDVLDGDDLGPTLQGAAEVPLLALRNGTTARLDVPVRSKAGGADRVLLPNPGVHPVEVELVSPSAGELQRTVLFLNRLPADEGPAAMRVAPMVSVLSGPVVATDGTVAVPPDAGASMSAATELLRAAGDVPLTVQLDPELVAGATSPPDRTRLQDLLSVVRDQPVLRSTWAPMDLESWATSGSLANFQTAVLAGQQTLTDALGHPPTGGVWPPDPTLGQESPGWLDAIGVRRVLLRSDQLAPTRDLGTDAGTSQRFKVGSADSRVDGLLLDATVTSRLVAGEPALAAHRALTELEATWFAASPSARTAVVVDLTGVPVPAASAFLDALGADNPSLRASSVAQAFDESSAYAEPSRRRSGAASTLVRRVDRSEPVSDEAAISRELTRLRTRADSYHASLEDPEGAASLDDLLLTVLHRDLDLAAQLGYLAAAGRRIDQGLAFVQPLESRSFTVTARRSELPLTIVNGGDRDMTVLLRFHGNRLEANDGHPRRVRLRPGPNSISVPVLARTSGDFRMVVEVRTADDAILLTSTAVRIRSTVVSGVGLVLAAGALGFLVLWWGRTIRRDRRARHAAAEPDPSPTDAPRAPVA